MTATIDTLPISEIFGPTWQGEGPSSGQLAAFVRLGGCNLTCRGCDTPYTWDASRFDLRAELTAMTAVEILAKVPATPLTVVSGGEPTMYQDRPAFLDLLAGLTAAGGRVEIETNGTRVPDGILTATGRVVFNVSPKLAGPMSDDAEEKRLVPAALAAYAALAARHVARWKFVVRTVQDVDAAVSLAAEYQVPSRAVWVMPEGNQVDTQLSTARDIADTALRYGINLTLRQHVLLWPKVERGR